MLNGLVKIEATVNWACYGGVSVMGIFMRDVWLSVKLENACDNAKSQEALQTLKVAHTRGLNPSFILKDITGQDFRPIGSSRSQ